MLDDLYVSTNCFTDRRPESIVAALEQLPEVGIELSAVEASEAQCIDFSRRLHGQGRRVVLHNYFPIPDHPFVLNLAARDPALRRQSIDFCRRALDLSAELGAPHYAVHPGFAVDFRTADLGNPERQAELAKQGAIADFDAFAAIAIASLHELRDYGAGVGVTLMAENNVVSPRSGPDGRRMIPMACPDELRRLIDAGIPLLFDVAHAKVTANAFGESAEDWVRILRPHISALHVSDNDGVEDSGDKFSRQPWFESLVRSQRHLPITLELNRKSIAEIGDHLNILDQWRS